MNEPSPKAKQAAEEAWDEYAPNCKPTWMRMIAEDKAFRIACNAADAATAKLREEIKDFLQEINDWVLWIKEPELRDEDKRAAKVAGLIDDFLHGEQLARQQPSATTAKLREDVRLFGEIMALMNGDGGHFQSEHGSKAAYERAVSQWNERYRRMDAAEYKLEQLARQQPDEDNEAQDPSQHQ